MLEKYEICCGLFHGFDWSTWISGRPGARLALLPAAQEHILAQEDGKARLLQAVTELSAAFALSVPADEALAMVVVERSDRPLVASNADLTGAGGLGSDLVARFLQRLSEEAGLTVHVRLMEGEDTGHALAAIFKALGVALSRAAAAT
jgi:imidazoleglycerol phosphate dehydratase HisB